MSIPIETKRLRLTKAREMLLALEPDKLHMRKVVDHADCGTAYCFAGWMVVNPWFRKHTTLGRYLAVQTDGEICLTNAGMGVNAISDHNEPALVAVIRVLGIEERDGENLTGCGLSSRGNPHSVSREEVLWNVDELLAGRAALPYRATGKNVPVYAGGHANKDYSPDRAERDVNSHYYE
jgi:hypothetical protein